MRTATFTLCCCLLAFGAAGAQTQDTLTVKISRLSGPKVTTPSEPSPKIEFFTAVEIASTREGVVAFRVKAFARDGRVFSNLVDAGEYRDAATWFPIDVYMLRDVTVEELLARPPARFPVEP